MYWHKQWINPYLIIGSLRWTIICEWTVDVMLVGVDRPPPLLTPGPLLVGGMLLVATLVSVVTCGPTRGGHVTRGHAQRLGDGCTMKTDTSPRLTMG